MLCPAAREPKMNASDPRPRTHPYSNLERVFVLVVAALKAEASARTLVGASIAACSSATNSKTGNPNAGQVRLPLPLLRRSPARCAMHAVDQLCALRVVRRSAESSWRGITRARDVQDLRRATKEIRAKRAMLPQRRHKAPRI